MTHQRTEAEALNDLANSLHDQGRYQEAIKAYQQAISIAPDCSSAYNNLSVTLNLCGHYAEALMACEMAVMHAPDCAEAYANKGIALKGLGHSEKAEAAYRQSLAIQPNNAVTHSSLGSLLAGLGRYDEAVAAYQQALTLKPNLQECRLKLALLLPPLQAGASSNQADVALKLALDELEQGTAVEDWPALGAVIGVVQPFTLAYRIGDHTAVLSRYGTIACRARAAWFTRHPQPERPITPRSSNRLRLLIISGQISNHSVWNVLLHGLLKHLDRTRFEVLLYNTSLKQTSEANLAQTLVERYHQGQADWLQQTLQDQPDAIFYPEIAMDPIAAQLATLRLAPLQLAGWGHPITTGLPTLDLFCSGELLERPDADHDYSEKLVRLPGTGACSVLPSVAAVPPDMTLLQIPVDRTITRFLICQQAVKFDPGFDDLYPRIALAATPCKFWFVRDSKNSRESSLLENRLNATFAAHDLNPSDYIHFIDWLSGEQFLGLLDTMDIYLDTPAFSGYTTAWQALHRGLPIITLEGRFMRQRLAAGLLRRIGLTATIAADEEDYIQKAAMLAASQTLRLKLRPLLQNAVTSTDEDSNVVRGFEAVIQQML